MNKLASAILAGALVLLSAAGLSAATLYVPGTYATIQAAIDAAAPDDVIMVAAGTYNESTIVIDKALTVQGAGIGSSIIDASASIVQGTMVTIDIASGNVLFDGFTLKTGASLRGISAISTSSGSTITISHNRIEGFGPTSTEEWNYGLIAGYGSVASLVFTHNEIYNCGDNTILIERHVGPTDISYNTFDRTAGDWSSDALFCMNYGGSDITTLQRISHNTIDMGAGTVFTNDTRGTAITVCSSYTGVVGGFTNVEITDNTIVNLKTYRRGIGTWNNAPSGTTSGATGDIQGLKVERNSISNAVGYAGQRGIDLLGLATGSIVRNNAVTGVEYGFRGVAWNDNLPTGAVVNGNSFASCTVNAQWSGAGTLDASGNWWGTNVGSEIVAKLSGSVDYTPWLDGGSDGSGDPGFQGDLSELWVDDDSPQTGSTGRVQEGVDLVTGSAVYLAPGTYEEQVEITKTLTLDGGGGGGIIKSPVTLTKYFLTNKPIVYVHDCDGVVIKDLTVDGAGRGNLNYRFCGIAFWNAGGTVDGCIVKDVQDTPFSGNQHGVGIYSYSSGTTAYAINVWDCELYGIQKTAIALNAGDTNPLAVDVRRNTVTGIGPTSVTAQNGIQVSAVLGSGTLEDNAISGIGYTGSGWVATSILDYDADLTITGNTVTGGHMGIYTIDAASDIVGNNLTIEKIGYYAIGISASDPPDAKPSPIAEEETLGSARRDVAGALDVFDIDIEGNAIAFSGADNAGTIGIETDAGYYSDAEIDLAVNGNTVTGFDYGIGFYQWTEDTGSFTSIVARYNTIAGNTSMGMESNADYLTVNATSNWWGDATGPYHDPLNTTGLGNAVSDYIDFDPYMGSPNEVSVTPAATLTNCSTAKTVVFAIDQAGIPTPVRGYEVQFQIDTARVKIAAPSTDIAQGTFLSAAGSTQFFVLNNGGGVYTVSCAILGTTAGATGHGNLFSVLLTPKSEGTGAIAILSLKVRDLNNLPISSSAVGGSIRLDCTAPTMDAIAEAQGGWYNAAPALSHAGFDDDLNLDLAEYNYDGGAWTAIFSGVDAASWDADPWTLPGFASLGEGAHTIWFRVRDDAGNWNAGTYGWQFYKDTTPPQPPTNFVSLPGHDKTHLSWTNPTGDDTFVGVEIRLNGWLDYPEYEATTPVYPADHTAGTYVALATGTAYDDNPRTPRDIYYYAAFSKDLAGNYSTLGTTAHDRCTSYWLGDVSGDGIMNVTDLVTFSGAFGTVEGGGGWVNTCDFGPTDDWSRLGVPLPDDMIDFEDLMIFAMNYGVVTPAGLGELAAAAGRNEDLAKAVGLDLVANDDGTYSLVLANRASTLKGLRVVVEITSGSLDRVSRGALFAGNGDLFFGLVPGDPNAADISAAALGTGKPLAGSGEVARLAIRPDGEQPVRARIASIDLRDLDNVRSEIDAAGEYEAPFVPRATALMQNFPNPFNPSTTVTFDLTAAGRVRIDLYDVSGRLVAVLFDGTKGPGRHRVEWNGRDASGSLAPSGIYFYRMKTAGYEATRKMILVR